MPNVKLKPLKSSVAFRKIAMGTWDRPKDPSVYGFAEINMQPILEFISGYNSQHNVKITPTHIVAKAVAICMKNRPEINGLIRFQKIFLRQSVRAFFQVNVPGKGNDAVGKAELSGATVDFLEDKTLVEIETELRE